MDDATNGSNYQKLLHEIELLKYENRLLNTKIEKLTTTMAIRHYSPTSNSFLIYWYVWLRRLLSVY